VLVRARPIDIRTRTIAQRNGRRTLTAPGKGNRAVIVVISDDRCSGTRDTNRGSKKCRYGIHAS
jgi:hypothetical protein